jgi:hypothetical protein
VPARLGHQSSIRVGKACPRLSLAFLAGCDIVDSASAERALMQVSYFNDRVQTWLFNPNKLAPTFPQSAVTRPFPFNAYYPEEDAPEMAVTNKYLGGYWEDQGYNWFSGS